nr:MAG TPA: hypothetical protein [Caudoviricetes sp.]
MSGISLYNYQKKRSTKYTIFILRTICILYYGRNALGIS